MRMIPVHKPKLPNSEKILPYLKFLDKARWYSNFGSLLQRFEERLAEKFQVSEKELVTAANGTLMLSAFLKTLKPENKSVCLMPSWTFIATAASAYEAGLTPYFLDVDPVTQALDPTSVKEKLTNIELPVAALIVVAPFGAPLSRQEWDKFTQETHIPVIIDAAAGFDAATSDEQMLNGHTPIMVSMHATKVFGIGEGGILITRDAELTKEIRARINFGFNASRESLYLGFNAKLTEYAAAVGLAVVDEWEETKQQWLIVRDIYQHHLNKRDISHSLSSRWISGTCNVQLPHCAQSMSQDLAAKGIDTRQWWLKGCHQHKAYQHFPKENDLSVTHWLGESTLGIPYSIDLSEAEIEYICTALQFKAKNAVNCR